MARNLKPRRYPLVEWASAAIGLAITGGMFGFLALEALRQRDNVPPLMDVVPVALVAFGDRYLVEVDVTNAARRTGAEVQVEGTLNQDGSTVETSSATVAYVPGESRRRAGLVFTKDPRKYRLDVRVTGYERP